MSGFFQNLLKDTVTGFFSNDYVRDYTHASKTFLPNALEYAPKLKFLFHVYFNISSFPRQLPQNTNLGLTVKTVSLPSYTIDTKQLNQYNRKRIVQTKLKYDPVTITFHDDNGNNVRNMWYNYYTYYYGDQGYPKTGSDGTSPAFSYWERTQYMENINDANKWGFYGETIPVGNGATREDGKKVPFFTDITIYGFNQHNFVSYKLINPMITSFKHDTYDYNQGGGIMENTMTIDYETVEYAQGAIDGTQPSNRVPRFAEESHYDRRLSPIARPGANSNILGQGGLLDAVGGILNNIEQGNILGAIQQAGSTYNTFKNGNLKKAVNAELNKQLGSVLVAGTTSSLRNTRFNTPIYNSTPSTQVPVETRTPRPVSDINRGPGG